MPRFLHSFTVRAPLQDVAAFHRDTRALKRLTPPPLIVQLQRFEPMGEGAEAEFTLWFGPVPVRWLAVHSDVGANGFVDRQVRGPLAYWRHTHRFEPLDAHNTRVTDLVEYEHHDGWRGWLSALPFNRVGLALLFAFRAQATRWYLRPAPARSRRLKQIGLAALLASSGSALLLHHLSGRKP